MAKGAAWSVPAVAVAAAAPAYAKSGIVTVSEAGPACKLPGNSCGNQGWSKGYLQPLQICNAGNTAVTVTIKTPAYLTINGTQEVFTPVPSSFTIPAPVAPQTRVCQTVTLNINLQDNSQNSSISGTIYWTFTAGTVTGEGSTEINTAATPPCVNCAPTTSAQTVAATEEANAGGTLVEEKAEAPVEEAAEAPKTETQKAEAPTNKAEAPKAEEPAPAPEPKAEEPAPAEPSEPADEA